MSEQRVEITTQAWLKRFIEEYGGVAGTVHYHRHGVLEQAATVNIPEKVRAITATIPRGKGMAGLAWERGRPVQTCNLKEDPSSDIRPGARAVDAHAAVALPVFDEAGRLKAVVGIAFMHEDEIGEDEIARLHQAASHVPSP